MLNYKYVIKKLEDVTDTEMCSVDSQYTVSHLGGLLAAFHLGNIDLDDYCHFDHKDAYRFAPKTSLCLVRLWK